MRKAGSFEAKTHFSQLLREVETTHESIIIQRRGKDVAILAPCTENPGESHEDTMRRVMEGFRELREAQLRRGFKPLKGDEIKSFITDGRER